MGAIACLVEDTGASLVPSCLYLVLVCNNSLVFFSLMFFFAFCSMVFFGYFCSCNFFPNSSTFEAEGLSELSTPTKVGARFAYMFSVPFIL